MPVDEIDDAKQSVFTIVVHTRNAMKYCSFPLIQICVRKRRCCGRKEYFSGRRRLTAVKQRSSVREIPVTLRRDAAYSWTTNRGRPLGAKPILPAAPWLVLCPSVAIYGGVGQRVSSNHPCLITL